VTDQGRSCATLYRDLDLPAWCRLPGGREIADLVVKLRPARSTFRPHVATAEMAELMAIRDLPNAPVTTSAGELIDLLVREDAERAAHERIEPPLRAPP
jgi:hypothetical protein